MRLLLDTHVFLWWLADDGRLGSAEREAIRDPGNDVCLSAASVWEIVIKQALGRLRTPEPASAAAQRLGLQPLPITFEHAEATASYAFAAAGCGGATTCEPLWSTATPSPPTGVIVANGRVFVTTTTGDLVAYALPAT